MRLPISDTHMNSARKNGHSPALQSVATVSRPDPEVSQRASRRRFTAGDKLRILAEADSCNQPGQLGALLRREGLYSSNLASFRKQRDAGKLGKDPQEVRQQRREKEAARQRDTRRIAHLEAENKKLRVLLDLQKKVAEVMDLSLEPLTDG